MHYDYNVPIMTLIKIKKKNFSDQNEEVSGDESSKNVTRDGIEALKPYEI